MANFKLHYAFKDGVFYLCVTTKITDVSKTKSQRNYRKVEGLISPNFENWNSKKQIFNEPSESAIHNNKVLQQMKNHYQELIDSFNPSSGKELLNLNNSDATKEEQKGITWGDYIRKLISDRKTESIKNPSKTYQKYINLLHKLEREGKILNKPLSEICNKDFIDFGDFILHKLTDKEGRSNYSNIMKLFKAVHNIAANKELNNNTLRYNYNQYAPIKNSKEIFIFTEKQYEKFQLYDLSKIPQKGTDAMFKKSYIETSASSCMK